MHSRKIRKSQFHKVPKQEIMPLKKACTTGIQDIIFKQKIQETGK